MSILKLENNKIVLAVNIQGGAITDFHLKEVPVNPLNWQCNDPELPPFEGHFLCFARWGPPSEGERKNGIPHHGEVTTQRWFTETKQADGAGLKSCLMTCRLPKGKMDVTRLIELAENEPVVMVTEQIRNRNKFGLSVEKSTLSVD